MSAIIIYHSPTGRVWHDGTLVEAYGFDDPDTGCFVWDPCTSECGRFEVNPRARYGLTTAEVAALITLNDDLERRRRAAEGKEGPK